jgi:hypothetical protein
MRTTKSKCRWRERGASPTPIETRSVLNGLLSSLRARIIFHLGVIFPCSMPPVLELSLSEAHTAQEMPRSLPLVCLLHGRSRKKDLWGLSTPSPLSKARWASCSLGRKGQILGFQRLARSTILVARRNLTAHSNLIAEGRDIAGYLRPIARLRGRNLQRRPIRTRIRMIKKIKPRVPLG